MIIRQAQPDDAGALLPLAAQLATSFDVDPQAFRDSFTKCIGEESSLILVAEDSSGLAGYLLGSDHHAFFANGRVSNVEEVYVRPDQRRRGLGTRLMREFEKWAASRGSAQVTVCTRRASEFYAALGYEETAACYRTVLKERPGQGDGP